MGRVECDNAITVHIRHNPSAGGVLFDSEAWVQPNEFEYFMLECIGKYPIGDGSNLAIKRRVYPPERRVDSNSRFGL
jgi:hypothetical protein